MLKLSFLLFVFQSSFVFSLLLCLILVLSIFVPSLFSFSPALVPSNPFLLSFFLTFYPLWNQGLLFSCISLFSPFAKSLSHCFPSQISFTPHEIRLQCLISAFHPLFFVPSVLLLFFSLSSLLPHHWPFLFFVLSPCSSCGH